MILKEEICLERRQSGKVASQHKTKLHKSDKEYITRPREIKHFIKCTEQTRSLLGSDGRCKPKDIIALRSSITFYSRPIFFVFLLYPRHKLGRILWRSFWLLSCSLLNLHLSSCLT